MKKTEKEVRRDAPIVASGNGCGNSHPACERCGNHAKLHKVKVVGEDGVSSMMVCAECD